MSEATLSVDGVASSRISEDWLAVVIGLGVFAHGEASFQGQLVMMGRGAHERNLTTPQRAGAATMGVFIYRDDVDKHYAAAEAAGAEIVDPPKDVPYGRTYSAVDPGGHLLFFTTPPKAD